MRPLATVLVLSALASCVVPGEAAARALQAPQDASPRATGFETLDTGALLAPIATPVGIWSAAEGHAEIDEGHARSGRRCLRIRGGEERSVELRLPGDRDGFASLCFTAERWTRRDPFRLRVEGRRGETWIELHVADDEAPVGRLGAPVRVKLEDPRIERLRLVCTSPSDAGALIDDVRLLAKGPRRVIEARVTSLRLPALRGLESTPLSRLLIEVDGTEGDLALTGVDVDAKASSGSLARLSVLSTGARSSFSSDEEASLLADGHTFDPRRDPTALVRFRGSLPLSPGTNVLWIVGRLRDDVDLDGRIAVAWKELRFSDGRRLAPRPDADPAPSPSRTGVALRRAGDGGVHTTRIPGLATTAKGTLIAVYDLRHRGAGDLPGDIDVGMSRSVDGGRSWEPTRTIIDMGSDPDWRHDGVGDPSILVDRGSNTIWVAALWSHGDRGWTGSGPGLEPTETGQLVLVKSEDDGRTWSRPINITKQVKRPEWTLLLQGPGKGIRMKDGTLVFPAQYRDSAERGRIPHSTIISSRDGGRTWRAGTGAHPHTTEAQVVETEPGVLMLNCRYDRADRRVVMITKDLGATWTEHESSRKLLVEPGACMASLIEVGGELGEAPRGHLIFSNPESERARERITVKASHDGGRTWPPELRLRLDEGRGAGYSCLTMIDDETLGILYEGSLAHLVFQRIALADLDGR